MPLPIVSSTVAAARAWLRARRPTRESIVIAGALALVFGASYLTAFYVRSELLLQAADARTIVRTIAGVVLAKLVIFYSRGICHRPVRTIRFEDLSSLVRATTTALLVFVAINFYMPRLIPDWPQIPRTVILLDWAFTVLAVGGMQATARSIYDELMPANPAGQRRTALFIDASPDGQAIVEALADRNGGEYIVSGLLDDDPEAYGQRLAGTRVIGTIDDAAPCAERLRVAEVMVRRGSVFGRRLRDLCEACAALRVRVAVAERSGDSGAAVRGVELRDLIPRFEESFERHDEDVRRWLAGQTVLVTGAGGTVGAEVCRQVMRCAPAKLLLVERSDQALAAIDAELRETAAAGDAEGAVVVPVLVDVAKVERAGDLLAQHRPGIVVHAAALNHLPMLEANPLEAVEGNLFAAVDFAELCHRNGVASFVALSTDKAVHPTSVMGATRLLGERFLQSLAADSDTRFVIARVGNVLGATGSAVPLFNRLLRQRRPITVNDPGMARHFVTVYEAARVVLVAGAIGKSGEAFVPDMAPPMPIVDLVESLAFLQRIPRDEVEIRYGSPRRGEKLTEELFFEDEVHAVVAGTALHRATRRRHPVAGMRERMAELKRAVASADVERSVAALWDMASDEADARATAGLGPRADARGAADE